MILSVIIKYSMLDLICGACDPQITVSCKTFFDHLFSLISDFRLRFYHLR